MTNYIENINPKENIQALYESIIQSSEDAIISKTINGIITSWNPSAEILFGYTTEEAIGKHISLIIPTNRLDEETEIVEKIRRGEHIKHYETERLNKKGDLVNISLTVSPIKNAEGSIIGASKIVRNITDRIKTENQLKQSLKELVDYKYALDQSSIVAITDQNGIIKYVNNNFCKASKYAIEELIGNDHRIVNSGHHSKEFISNLWTTITDGKIWKGELKNKAKDGTFYWVNTTIVPFLNNEGKPYQYVAIRNDITERKKAEEELVQLNTNLDKKVLERTQELLQAKNELTQTLERVSFLASIANSIQDPIISTNGNGVITRWNEAAEKLLEWKSEEVIGKTVLEILNPEYLNESREEIFELLKTQPHWQGEVIFYTKSHKPIDLLITGSLLKDSQNNIVGVLTVGRDITKRKIALKQLEEFKHFFNNSNDISGIANDKGYFEVINKSFIEVLGYFEDELLQNSFLKFVHPDDIAVTINEYEKLKSGADVIHFLNRYQKKDGSYLWFEWNATPNIITGKLYCIARDITERKDAEEALYKLNNELEQRVKERTEEIFENEKKYRLLFENNPLPFFALDLKSYQFLDVNKSALNQYGYSKEEFLSMTAIDLRPVDSIDKFKNLDFTFKENLSNRNLGIWDHRKKDGTVIQVEIIINDVLLFGNESRLVLANDVTEKKRIEEKLIASELQFRHTLDNMLEGAQIIGFDWRYIYVNDSMANHGKYSKEELIGFTVMEKYPGIEHTEIFKIYEKCFTERVPIHLENEFVFPDKTVGWFELSFQPVPEGIFILSVDITSRKKAEQEIALLNETLEQKVIERTEQLQAANKELDAFSYSVSHDLRAPLRAVNGYSNMLLEDFGTKLEPEANRIVNNVMSNVVKMGNLIDDLLSFSRLGRKELVLSKISMQDMVTTVSKEIIAEHPDRNIEVNIQNLEPICGDITSIKQVWINLISNAVKYSRRNEKTIIEIGCNVFEEDIIYYVKDNGVGFDMRYADKLFGVFQRLHNEKEFEGTGVGLAIVQRILAKHSGKIWAESKINEGAIFYFTLKKAK